MIYPTLTYDDAHAAIEFLCTALGFERQAVHEDGGRVAHAELRFGDGLVMVGSGNDPAFHTGKTVVYVTTDDVDGVHARARDAGATIVRAPSDTDYGSRDCAVEDPEGNVWSFGTYRPATGS